MITPEQRYRNAITKSVILARRAVRQFLAGNIPYIEGCTDERCLVDALRLAYEAGAADCRTMAERLRGAGAGAADKPASAPTDA